MSRAAHPLRKALLAAAVLVALLAAGQAPLCGACGGSGSCATAAPPSCHGAPATASSTSLAQDACCPRLEAAPGIPAPRPGAAPANERAALAAPTAATVAIAAAAPTAPRPVSSPAAPLGPARVARYTLHAALLI